MKALPGLRRLLRHWRVAVGGLLMLLLVLAAVRYWPRDPLSASVSQSVAVLDRHGRLLRLGLAGDDRYRLWTPIEQMPPELIDAVLLHEDAGFRWHPGVNPVSLLRGAWSTYGSGEARIGGSTLTMQLARLRWKLDTRTPSGKIEQMARALQLEACHGKKEILEAYLNLAPYGGNIEGVGAASQIYFHKLTAK